MEVRRTNMENKEVEKMLESIKFEYALLEGKIYYQSKDVENLLEDNQSLTKENAELKQQLQAKDKALDKACEKIAYDNGHRDDGTSDLECPATQYSFSPTICGEDSDCEDCCVKCWKEWAENELGKTMKEINQMSINACGDIMASIDFEETRKEYEDGIDYN